MRHKLFIIIYAIFALITSGCGGGSSDSNNTQNKPPKVSVNSVTVQETQFVTLMATATDEDGVITSYRWRQTSGNTVSLNDATGETLSFHAPTISSEQTLKFDITVIDDKGAQASATATVNIVANSAPVINVSDIETAESTNVTITAMISDTDGTIKSIEWQQTEGPNVTATGLNSSVLSFVSPSVSQDTLIRFSLTATDNLNKATTQIVSILVKNSNLAPLVSVSDVSFFESEQVLISSSASDPDGSVEQYLWQQVSGITVALPITNEPELKFIAPAVNKDETLSFRLTVSDNQNVSAAATADVLIKFNPAPVITLDDITTTENTLQTLTATVNDDGSISEINWRQTAGPAVNFVVTNPTSIEFTTPDVQSDTMINFTVAATDNLGKTSEVTNQVLVTSRETSYTLKGKVIDSPVANAITWTPPHYPASMCHTESVKTNSHK
uniref:OmpA-like transmembrane domain protein n=1 Tax=Rheinheimera sp. BAL341 TaxID=1708203 RepID=A0A486XKC9_9GAMM